MKFSKEQLVFLVNTVFEGAWDRIDSYLPERENIEYWKNNRQDALNLIAGAKQTVSATLPILYANLTKDGMGIGEFYQYEEFSRQVDRFIERKTDPRINHNNLTYPSSTELAKQFVEDYLNDYLEGPVEIFKPGE